jgi:hypothetical protein
MSLRGKFPIFVVNHTLPPMIPASRTTVFSHNSHVEYIAAVKLFDPAPMMIISNYWFFYSSWKTQEKRATTRKSLPNKYILELKVIPFLLHRR